MAAEAVRWGILSTANIGKSAVIPAIHASRNGTVVAVASRDLRRAERFGEANGIPACYGDYQALLEAPDVDAVYIPLPNSLHKEWVVRAAHSGKHILCEKPLGLTAAECEDMIQAADEAGVLLMEAFMYRFHPRMQRLLEMCEAGAIGNVRQISAAFTFRLSNPDNIRLNPALGGGSLMDVGCYCVNCIRAVAQACGYGEPEAVHAAAEWTERGVDQAMVGTLLFSGGLMATFSSALSLERREEVTVAGTHGYLHVPAAFLPGTADVAIQQQMGRSEATTVDIAGVDEYQCMLEQFADAVLEERRVPYAPDDSMETMRVIEALYRSCQQGGAPVAL